MAPKNQKKETDIKIENDFERLKEKIKTERIAQYKKQFEVNRTNSGKKTAKLVLHGKTNLDKLENKIGWSIHLSNDKDKKEIEIILYIKDYSKVTRYVCIECSRKDREACNICSDITKTFVETEFEKCFDTIFNLEENFANCHFCKDLLCFLDKHNENNDVTKKKPDTQQHKEMVMRNNPTKVDDKYFCDSCAKKVLTNSIKIFNCCVCKEDLESETWMYKFPEKMVECNKHSEKTCKKCIKDLHNCPICRKKIPEICQRGKCCDSDDEDGYELELDSEVEE